MQIYFALFLLAAAPSLDWPQWGGPERNFKSGATGLANSWPANGPKRAWSRNLGDGYSAISVERGVVYTMYRQATDEVVLAASGATGKTIWEYRYNASFRGNMGMENGSGPHATPLVTENGVYAIGILQNLLCLDKKTGKVIWSHDLLKEFKGTSMDRGYANSPIAYGDNVILPVGGAGHSFIAFNQKTGAVAWKTAKDLENGYSSPILIRVDGQDQIVCFMASAVAGIDPTDGSLLWTYPHRTNWGLNISTPVWGDGNLLFISSAYGSGSEMIRLTRKDGKTIPQKVWSANRMHIHHGTAIRVGDYLYGSSGDFGPAPMTAVEAATGKVIWQDRAFPKANFIYADGKFVVVDEDGNLALANFSPPGLQVLSKVHLLESNAWTAPTLVGKRLYVRDRTSMLALDLP